MNHEYTPLQYNQLATAEDSVSESLRQFELDHFVKEAPRLTDQLRDESRTNRIMYIKGSSEGLLTDAHSDDYRDSRETITEVEALRELDDFLALVQQELPDYAGEAKLMQENLTYIGEKEYKEAAAAIASYWKMSLDENPDLQILALVGEVAKKQQKRHRGGGAMTDLPIKSDEYLLENILENFTEEELIHYGGRLLVDAGDITAQPDNTRVVLLDDWTISGSQLFDAYSSFTEDNPGLENAMEVQLITAHEKTILEGFDLDGEGKDTIPLRAYYKAHHSDYSWQGSHHVHITGSHSAVDFDFEDEIQIMAEELNAKGVSVAMPATTNIVRPYRYDGMTRAGLMQRQRLEAIRRSHRETTEVAA